jgi:hypothetical protein
MAKEVHQALTSKEAQRSTIRLRESATFIRTVVLRWKQCATILTHRLECSAQNTRGCSRTLKSPLLTGIKAGLKFITQVDGRRLPTTYFGYFKRTSRRLGPRWNATSRHARFVKSSRWFIPGSERQRSRYTIRPLTKQGKSGI